MGVLVAEFLGRQVHRVKRTNGNRTEAHSGYLLFESLEVSRTRELLEKLRIADPRDVLDSFQGFKNLLSELFEDLLLELRPPILLQSPQRRPSGIWGPRGLFPKAFKVVVASSVCQIKESSFAFGRKPLRFVVCEKINL